MRFPCSETPVFANHNGSSAETGFTNNFYAAFTRRFACRANTGPANHNGTSAQTHFANILHEEDSQRHQRRQRAPQPLLEGLGTAPATKTASGTSGDNPRRSPFWRLWVLRLPRGRQPAAPAATTRAAAPSGGSGYCACLEDSQRHPAAPAAKQFFLYRGLLFLYWGLCVGLLGCVFFHVPLCVFVVWVVGRWVFFHAPLCVFVVWVVGRWVFFRLCAFVVWVVGRWVGGWAGGPPCAEKGDLAIAGWWQPRNSEQKPSKLGWKATCAFCIVCKKE